MHQIADCANPVYGIDSDYTLRNVWKADGYLVAFFDAEFHKSCGTGFDEF